MNEELIHALWHGEIIILIANGVQANKLNGLLFRLGYPVYSEDRFRVGKLKQPCYYYVSQDPSIDPIFYTFITSELEIAKRNCASSAIVLTYVEFKQFLSDTCANEYINDHDIDFLL